MTTSSHIQTKVQHSLYWSPLTHQSHLTKTPKLKIDDQSSDEFIWKQFLDTHPIIGLLRPDFYMIYKFSKSAIVYQQNINLNLGIGEVTFDRIMDHFSVDDRHNIHVIDNAMSRIISSRKLQPFDYIYKICGNVKCPNNSVKRIMRTSFLLHAETTGAPGLGFVCFNDVTAMVSSIKPNNYDISFDPGQPHLSRELSTLLKESRPSSNIITSREKDILNCIDQGMNSKAIASHLFIAKSTVDTHRQNMLRKWNAPNTAALLKIARNEGLI